MKRIKVGIIGQGRSGRNIHRHLFETCPQLQERFEVVAVADPIPERVVATNPGASKDCKCYSDYRELLEDKNVELVINASRSHKHVDISRAAIWSKGRDLYQGRERHGGILEESEVYCRYNRGRMASYR